MTDFVPHSDDSFSSLVPSPTFRAFRVFRGYISSLSLFCLLPRTRDSPAFFEGVDLPS